MNERSQRERAAPTTVDIHRSADRFVTRLSWLDSRHSFSYGRHYYQQRYNFIEPDDDLTLDQRG